MMIIRLQEFARHFRVRRTEWLLAIVAFVLGLAYLSQPELFAERPFLIMRQFGNHAQWGGVITALASVRLAMLWINGRWRVTPFVRAAGAFLSSGLWFALFMAQSFVETPPQARWIWLVFLAFDLLNAGDAAFDAGIAAGDRAKGRTDA